MIKIPKRKKDRYNPYILAYDQLKNQYFVKFENNNGVRFSQEISIEIYNVFNEFELEDIRQMHKFERHIEHMEISEEDLYKRGVEISESVYEEFIKQSLLKNLKIAIESLSEIQKRRIKKYYFQDKTEQEIACEEKTTRQAINKSIKEGRKNLKIFLKKLKF